MNLQIKSVLTMRLVPSSNDPVFGRATAVVITATPPFRTSTAPSDSLANRPTSILMFPTDQSTSKSTTIRSHRPGTNKNNTHRTKNQKRRRTKKKRKKEEDAEQESEQRAKAKPFCHRDHWSSPVKVKWKTQQRNIWETSSARGRENSAVCFSTRPNSFSHTDTCRCCR